MFKSKPSSKVINEAILWKGNHGLSRSSDALFWSGLAAGLSIIAWGAITHCLPDVPWRPLVANRGYPLSFLAVVL